MFVFRDTNLCPDKLNLRSKLKDVSTILPSDHSEHIPDWKNSWVHINIATRFVEPTIFNNVIASSISAAISSKSGFFLCFIPLIAKSTYLFFNQTQVNIQNWF